MKYTQCPPLLKENGELFKLEFARYETGGRDAAALQPRAPRRGDVYGISLTATLAISQAQMEKLCIFLI